jgi:hypothetical protein
MFKDNTQGGLSVWQASLAGKNPLRDGEDGGLNVDLGRLIPVSGSGGDLLNAVLDDGLGDGELAIGGLGGDGRALEGVGAAAEGLAASGEGRESNAIDGQLVTRDDVVGEAAAELATGGGRHDLPRTEISGSGGGADGEESSN